MLTGIAVGAHAYYPETIEKHVHIAQLARVLTSAAPYAAPAREVNEETIRSFSPGHRMATTESVDGPANVRTVEQPASPILNTAPKLVRSTGWGATVVHTAGLPDSQTRPLSDADRWRLVRNIQSELRRAGCYWGKLDGSWGAGSKYGIQEFLLQVNASLPTTSPEPIMLTLLQSHPGTVCGKECEDGYTKSANGLCLPYAITAEKRPELDHNVVTPPARLVRSGTVDAAGTTPRFAQADRQYPEGRMAIGGPVDAIDPRYSAPDVASAPPLIDVAPNPVQLADPVYRPGGSKKSKAISRRNASKKYRSATNQKARRKALIRQAFGDGFD
ncbi:MAG: hypothetical protein APF80_07110 [Alphaproteobacteria bacterium BRH_c36]|nr:MAG: hypothetical protein APF80_07110 [Alphaproteobacteria bacterium BRH_c36]